MKDWQAIRPRFRREVLKRGTSQMARDLPASRRSVYRWMDGKAKPCQPALKRITEVLGEDEE